MKKIITIITIVTIAILSILGNNVHGASLNTLTVETNKKIVRPGEELKVTINFGQNLGAYTFNIAYDDNIFEYVSVDGGTANDTKDKVKVTFFDSTGGSNPRTNMSIIFRAKSGITTSNPTEITVTGEGLANADASVNYDDIATPIVKNIIVEPEYVDYTLKLTHTGNIVKNVAKDMVISYSSPMGRYYDHARLVAEAITPKGGTVTLIGTDSKSGEFDIIQSGWGDAQGYKIGGKDVSQVLNIKGTFTQVGDYTITLKLIDRDNSDKAIAQKDFKLTVVSEETTEPPTNTDKETPTTPEVTDKENVPSRLPKTGLNIYIQIATILSFALMVVLVIKNRKNK